MIAQHIGAVIAVNTSTSSPAANTCDISSAVAIKQKIAN